MGQPELRAQYARDIAPRTEAALAKILRELPADFVPRRALDLGAGTGAGGRALRDRYGPAVSVCSVDKVPSAPGVLVADLTRGTRPEGVRGRFELVLAAHVINELLGLDRLGKARLVRGWLDELVTPEGFLVLLEPALRETSRGLLELRDEVLRLGLTVHAPCLHQGACPALARDRDWCHDSAPWQQPPSEGQRRSSRVDYSYLILSARPAAAADPRRFRVVSDALVEKGRLRLFACGADGRHAFVRQNRDESDENGAFGALERGDVMHVEDTGEAGDGRRVLPTARVRKEGAT